AAAAIRELGFGVAVCGCVAQEGRRIIAQFIQQTDDPRTELVKSYGVQAYCCHPLMAQGRLIGTLSFGTRTRPVFTPDEVALMKSVADQVAVAMQRLLAEQAVRESEEKLRSAFANAAIGFAIAAPEGLVVDANPAFCAITGYSLEELLTMEIPQLVHPEDGAENMRLIGRMIAGQIPDFVVENRFVRKDGESVWVRKSVSLVRKAGGAPRWTLALVEDITERKRAEDALEKAHAELTARARKLEETNRELEGYAYTISHDLRTPLRAISGFSHMLADDYGPSMDEEGRRRLSVIEANAVKMGTLIDDLLAFSRAGRAAMNVSRIEMNELVAEIVETINALEPSSKTDIRVNGLPPALGDPALIRQALTNLLENAVKFSRERPFPRIEVGSFKQEGEQVYFLNDNGVSFDMKSHKRLFGVFERLVSDEEFEGTGVGLAIVHRVVTRHGGRVWAEGRLHEGATFYFTLPKGN
ncbi:MAG: PAS domain S-box protein, partial [Desulfobacterales bacterium]|nr:PAS domain S-box protein [Desulfobacterales bacterium]